MQRKQEQSAGSSSTNVQVGQDAVVYVGISASEARDIALDVFKANFLTLSGVAEQTARDRAERLTREYLEQLARQNPAGLANIRDPDMLQAIYIAQKGYVCSGEEDLESALVALLIDRSGLTVRDLKTLVLNEAIACLPRLTSAQRRAIAFRFLIRHHRYDGPLVLESFYQYIHRHLVPFANIGGNTGADYRYVQSIGLATQGDITNSLLGYSFLDRYYGFFNNGFTVERLPDVMRGYIDDPSFFIQCLRNPQVLQFNARSVREVANLQREMGYLVGERSRPGIGEMKMPDIQDDIVRQVPPMEEAFDHWNSSDLKILELTTVGIAIGHAYWRSITGEPSLLDTWLS